MVHREPLLHQSAGARMEVLSFPRRDERVDALRGELDHQPPLRGVEGEQLSRHLVRPLEPKPLPRATLGSSTRGSFDSALAMRANSASLASGFFMVRFPADRRGPG